ncbi:hypothetical protein N7530_005117 [Penicillium desertorum]|uniref:Uncharacterized protein n=1 Tax=Penicillium desertorum TaxID=1303715 RepID=A0A9W9WZI2_9EURO|nr:hypothetical protein N7530_005117 [Penicillium desertorum]
MSSDELERWAQVAELAGGPVEDLQINPQASIQCYVGRQLSFSWPQTVITEWINENHLIWTLCVALADSGLDREWTQGFDLYFRSQWVQIQSTVQQTQGVDRFLLDIPAPPMFMAVFAHNTGPAIRYHSIMSTHAGTRPGGGLLYLLRHLYHGGFSLTDVFIVVLYDGDVTGGAPQLPPSSDSDLADLFPERYATPPPPYRGTSPAPPDYAPPS